MVCVSVLAAVVEVVLWVVLVVFFVGCGECGGGGICGGCGVRGLVLQGVIRSAL